MSAREVITESATIGFEYGFMTAIIAFIQTKGDIKTSATCGVAMTAAMTAFDVSMSFFIPKSERPLHDESDELDTEDERKYINE